MILILKKNERPIDTKSKMVHKLDLAEKSFNAAIRNMLKY